MNLFFGIKNNLFKSELTIPKFKNRSKKIDKKIKLFAAKIIDNKWDIKMINCQENESFFFVKKEYINEKVFFFLASKNEINDYIQSNKINLENFNTYSDTWPAYRSNLRISNSFGGFSSYQSEYPYSMTTRRGSIISSINMLFDKNSDENYLIFVNILSEPLEKNFTIYLLNLKKKRLKKNLMYSQTKSI